MKVTVVPIGCRRKPCISSSNACLRQTGSQRRNFREFHLNKIMTSDFGFKINLDKIHNFKVELEIFVWTFGVSNTLYISRQAPTRLIYVSSKFN